MSDSYYWEGAPKNAIHYGAQEADYVDSSGRTETRPNLFRNSYDFSTASSCRSSVLCAAPSEIYFSFERIYYLRNLCGSKPIIIIIIRIWIF